MNSIETRLEQAESLAKQALEAVAKARELQEAEKGPWRPKLNHSYYYVRHSGVKWDAYDAIFKGWSADANLINAGNCFRTESEAQEIATQRNFMTELNSIGDVAPHERGYMVVLSSVSLEILLIVLDWTYGQRKFSTREKLLAWVEKWGGEAEVSKRLKVGWK